MFDKFHYCYCYLSILRFAIGTTYVSEICFFFFFFLDLGKMVGLPRGRGNQNGVNQNAEQTRLLDSFVRQMERMNAQ